MGLVWFSANWNNPVQWSHYADHHRDLCLGFKVTAQAHKVAYVSERLLAKPSALKSEGARAEAHAPWPERQMPAIAVIGEFLSAKRHFDFRYFFRRIRRTRSPGRCSGCSCRSADPRSEN